MYNTYEKNIIRTETILDGVSEDTTSKAVNVIGAKRIAIDISSDENISNRSGEFTVQASVDEGETFHDLNKLIENSATDRDALVGSVTVDSASDSVLIFVDGQVTGAITYVKVDVAVTDTTSPAGTFTSKISVQK